MSAMIFITTPCLNGASSIDRTILSVVNQAGDFFIRYHVQDGGSTDGTFERLVWWQRRLASPDFPLQCRNVEFTFASAPDKSMYDGLCAGFDALDIPANSFMTWINAGDILMPGALAFISSVASQFTPQQTSWVSGATSVNREDTPLVLLDSQHPTAVLRAGLCDGIHWSFLQQEGTFFRRWLWGAINPDETIRPLKLAGDWNLWRLFAGESTLVQTRFPLGTFHIHEDQLSARLRDQYMAEIDSIVSDEDRKASLRALGTREAICRRSFNTRYGDGRLTLVDEDRGGLVELQHMRVFSEKPGPLVRLKFTKTVAEGCLTTEVTKPMDEIVSFKNNILAYDHGWQFPAVTEQHAYHRLRDLDAVPDGVVYVAYPWANLIDKLQTNAFDAHVHMAAFREFCRRIPPGAECVTVFQHMKMQEFMHLFEESGIQNIFWAHATHEDLATSPKNGISLHAFPLYPVQVTEEEDRDAKAERPYLFSFIGAKSDKYYLTNTRELILDLLKDEPKGLIVGREGWHYHKVVYQHQILKDEQRGPEKEVELVSQSASDQFKASLAQSVFSLCPAGSGPNSIRLWESLGAGSIPVILADTYAPPGNPALWEQAAVFCKETPEAIRALPAILTKIAADPEKVARMRHAMRQLWMLYGPQSFVYDVHALMLTLTDQPKPRQGTDAAPSFRQRLLEKLPQNQTLSAQDATLLLRTCSGDLLLDRAETLVEFENHPALGQMLALAQENLGRYHPVVQHYQRVCTYVGATPARKPVSAPFVNGHAAPKIALVGRHSHRTPLSYAAFQKAAADRISLVQDPMQADFIMTGFNIDIGENADLIENVIKSRRDTKIVVISEEPLWDSTWSDGFVDRNRTTKCGETDLAYTFLNHTNSSIFNFDKIPYFLLTNEEYLTRFGLLISRHSKISPTELLEHWKNASIPAAFYAEARDDQAYAKAFPEYGVYGLSTYRTDIARKMNTPGVLREGKGWRSDDARRQDLPDWHLDKLAALDLRVRVTSAFENTHQTSYISEKIFDAFVVRSIPTYYADKNHRILDLVPESSMINTFGLTADEAAEKIQSFKPDAAFAKSWLNTVKILHATFTDSGAMAHERERIVSTLLVELEKL